MCSQNQGCDVTSTAHPEGTLVPFVQCCNSKFCSSVLRVQVSTFPALLQSPKSYQELLPRAQRVFFVQDTGKTLSLFKMHHKQIFLFLQSSSHLGKHFATHLLECRCLIICLIYNPVYHKLTKDFSTSKGAKSLDVSIITS